MLVVKGCLTGNNCQALLPIIRRLNELAEGMRVTVDLSTARHIEAAAIRILEQAERINASRNQANGKVLFNVPAVLPSCPALERAPQQQSPGEPGYR